MFGETVCNYDEGFIAGILSFYTGKPYQAIEVGCWATGGRYERCFSFGVVAVSDTGTGDEKTSDARCCDWETAMKRADEYMYRQKSQHKHCRV